MLVTQDEFGGRFDFAGLIAVHPCDGVRPRPRAAVVSVFESADALRFTAKESLVQDADCMAIGGGVVVIGRQPS